MRSFYLKLAIIFTAIIIVFGLLVAYISASASSNFMKESVQRTNKDLAVKLAEEFQPMLLTKFNQAEIEQKLSELSGLNPQFDFYLLNSQGIIKSYIPANRDRINPQVNLIDVEPLERFINGEDLPILSSDPLNPGQKKPFSATHISIMGSQGCYLYVVLESDQYSKTAALLSNSYIASNTLFIFGIVLFLSISSGLFLFKLTTKRLSKIKQTVRDFERGQLTKRIPLRGNDELTDLSKCFNSMADSLLENMEELKKADNLRRELVANVSHDLRSPLTSIQGYLETIQLKGDKITEEEFNTYMQIVINNTRKLNRLIEDLFELSKLDAKNVSPNLEYISMAELIQDLVQQFKPIAESKNIDLNVVFPDNPRSLIFADISLMDRALSNLIDNALKHTPTNGKVDIISTQNGTDMVLEITDSGSGIPEADLPHIFDRFYQVDKSRSDRDSAGLGLSIAQKIFELHGAKISVESLLNKGTTFKVLFPS
jgi:signal transduction histidine kinase